MNKDYKQILIDAYWFRIAKMLSNPSHKYNSAKKIKKFLQEVIDYLDKIIKLEEEDEN